MNAWSAELPHDALELMCRPLWLTPQVVDKRVEFEAGRDHEYRELSKNEVPILGLLLTKGPQ